MLPENVNRARRRADAAASAPRLRRYEGDMHLERLVEMKPPACEIKKFDREREPNLPSIVWPGSTPNECPDLSDTAQKLNSAGERQRSELAPLRTWAFDG